jgi:chromosome segregation ATPase
LVAVLGVLAAAGAGYFAWQSMGQIERLESEVNTGRSALSKARTDLKQATQERDAAAKEAKDLKIATDRLTAERDAVRKTLESEQATGVQLRAEAALAREQISYLSARLSKDVVRGMPKSVASK